MAVVRIMSPRMITWEAYEEVQRRIEADGAPDGLIVHTAVDNGGRPKIIDVWESEEHANRFGQERLGPVIAEVAPDAAGPPDPDQVEVLEVRNMMRG